MEIVKLGDIFDFSSGTSSLPKDYKNGDDILFINYKDVFLANPIRSKSLSKIKILKNKDYSNKMVSKNDLIITSSSETSKDNGMVSIYSDNTPALLNGFCKKMVINEQFENKIINKYIFYLLNTLEYRQRISNCSNGITRHNIIWNYFYKIEIKIIPFIDQQAIIDIIEPFEKLKEFLTQKKTILLRIIENMYYYNSKDQKASLGSFVDVIQMKYQGQKYYVDTSSIGVSSFLSREIIEPIKKSRANLTVQINSIIFSKMNGQNKIYPIYDEYLLDNVYSTGFYNVTSKNNLHLFGFLLSNNFISQKSNASVGTLMSGLNSQSLNAIMINEPIQNNNNDEYLLEYICSIDKIIDKISNIIKLLCQKYVS